MATPTAAQVRGIIQTSMTDEAIDAIISDAELLAGDCVSQYNDTRQTAILKWLTAHLISSMPGAEGAGKTLASKSLGDASESYSRASLGEMLKGTIYGQQALMLDTNGCLSSKGKRRVVMQVL